MTEKKPPLTIQTADELRMMSVRVVKPSFDDEFNVLAEALDLSSGEAVKAYCEAAANLVREKNLSLFTANDKINLLEGEIERIRAENSRLVQDNLGYTRTKADLVTMKSSRDWHKEALVPWVQKLNSADKIPVKYVEIRDVSTKAENADQLWNGAIHCVLKAVLEMKAKTKNPQKVLAEAIHKLFRIDVWGEIPLPESLAGERITAPMVKK